MKDLNGFYESLEKTADKYNGSDFCIQGRHSGKSFALQTFLELLTVAEALKAGRTIPTVNEQVVNMVEQYEIPVKPDGIGWIIG